MSVQHTLSFVRGDRDSDSHQIGAANREFDHLTRKISQDIGEFVEKAAKASRIRKIAKAHEKAAKRHQQLRRYNKLCDELTARIEKELTPPFPFPRWRKNRNLPIIEGTFPNIIHEHRWEDRGAIRRDGRAKTLNILRTNGTFFMKEIYSSQRGVSPSSLVDGESGINVSTYQI